MTSIITPMDNVIIQEELDLIEKWTKKFGIGRAKGSQNDEPINDDFSSLDVLDWWEKVESFQVTKKVVILLPCAKANISNKIIQDSVTHKYFAKSITRWYSSFIERLIISEPLTIIPYSMTDYPFYNYPPPLLRFNDALRRRPRDYLLFTTRLQSWFERQKNLHLWIWFGISRNFHHPRIIQAAWSLNIPCFAAIPNGGTKNIGKAAHCLRAILEEVVEGKKGSISHNDLEWHKLSFFIIKKEKKSIDPSKDSFTKQEVTKESFIQQIKETWKKINDSKNTIPFKGGDKELKYLLTLLYTRKGRWKECTSLNYLLNELPAGFSKEILISHFNNLSRDSNLVIRKKNVVKLTKKGKQEALNRLLI